MKKYSFILGMMLAMFFVACGGGGSSSSDNGNTSNDVSSINLEGNWEYTATLEGCDKKELGNITVEKGSNGYLWSQSTQRGLEANCSYGQEEYYSDEVDIRSDVSKEEFNRYYSSVAYNSKITNVVFNSADRITVNSIYDGKPYTTVIVRKYNNSNNNSEDSNSDNNNNNFDGNNYVGTYSRTSGNDYDWGASGAVESFVSNSKVNGVVYGREGASIAFGYEISDNRFRGTTSDGTSWEGIVTSSKINGTYRNSQWNCEGTFTLNRTN